MKHISIFSETAPFTSYRSRDVCNAACISKFGIVERSMCATIFFPKINLNRLCRSFCLQICLQKSYRTKDILRVVLKHM